MDDVLDLQKTAYEVSDELCWSVSSDCNENSCVQIFDLYPGSKDE